MFVKETCMLWTLVGRDPEEGELTEEELEQVAGGGAPPRGE
jgi:bacteriocin-like protein